MVTKRTDAQRRAAIAKLARQDPDFLNPIVTPVHGEMGAEDGGPSVKGGLKKLGKGLLNSLSVPQAVLYTTIQKALGDDISWKNTAGTFRGNKYKGGAGFLEALGVDGKAAKRWGGLGLDLVADPLNLVGVGLVAKGVKGAKAADNLDDIFKATPRASSVYEPPSKLQRTAMGKALTSDGKSDALKEVEKRIEKAVKQKKKRSHFREEEEQLILRETVARAFGTPKVAEAATRSRMAAVDTSQLAPRVSQTYKGAPANVAAGASGHARASTPLQGILDDAGLLTQTDKRYADMAEGARKQVHEVDRDVTIKLGVGKAAKHIKTGMTKKGKPIGTDLKRNFFRLRGAEKIGHSVQRTTQELAEGVNPALERFAASLGLTKADRVVIQTVGSFVAENQEEGLRLLDELRAAGQWTEKHDKALKYLNDKNFSMHGETQGFVDPKKRLSATFQQKDDAIRSLMRTATPEEAAELEKGLSNRGSYMPQTLTKDTIRDMQRHHMVEISSGAKERELKFNPNRETSLDPLAERQFDNPFQGTTQDDHLKVMADAGVDDATAKTLSERVSEILGYADAPVYSKSMPDVKYNFEWDSFLVQGERQKAHYQQLADNELMRLIKDAGLPDDIFMQTNTRRAPGAIGSYPAGIKLQRGISFMKAFFTTINPAHFVNNAYGDYINRLIKGEIGDIKSTASIPRSMWWKLANEDKRALLNADGTDRIYTVAGKDYTGGELLQLSRMAGLGRGYAGADIYDMVDIMHEGRNALALMTRFNMRRENAQRMETWVKNMNRGDDPFTAAGKSLKVHFDYNELTDFERVWMRNMLLFYTWMKRNGMLQVEGLAMRPGLYQGYADLEHNRTKFANEPEYYGDQGAITIPGLGNVILQNPMNDLHKLDFTMEGLRKNIGSAITPPARVPIELMSNRDMFTGAPVETYTDQNKPYFLSQIFGDTKVEGKPAMDAQAVHIFKSLLGPQAGLAQANFNEDNTKAEWLGRIFGYRTQKNDKDKFKEQQKAKETRRKADATRKRNKEKPQ